MQGYATRPTDMRLHLRADACLTVQRPPQGAGVPCAACAVACPAGAIALAPRSLHVDAARCTGCGICAPACPTGALDLDGFDPAPVLECARVAPADRAEGAGSVPCLGGLTAAHLRAIGGVTLVDRGWCADCPSSGARAAPWSEALQQVQEELTLIDREAAAPRVTVQPLAARRAGPPPAPPAPARLSRRDLFARMATPHPAPAQPDPLALLPGQVATPGPQARRAQLAALAGTDALPGVLFAKVTVPDGFADGPRLARLCPTGALRIEDTDAAEALIFDAARCIACGDCTAVPGVSLAPGAASQSGPVTLVRRTTARCPHCRMRFAPRAGQARCDGCAKDTDLAALAHGLMRRAPARG